MNGHHQPHRSSLSPDRTTHYLRRSGHLTLPLYQPLPLLGARCSGTRLDSAVEAVQPPEHRRPVSLSLCCCSGEETEREKKAGRKEEENEKGEDTDSGAHCTPPKSRRGNFTPSTETFVWSQTPTSNRWSSKCRSSHPTPRRVQWSKPHYSLDLNSTPHTSFQALCDPSHSAATHGCRVTLSAPQTCIKLPNSLVVVPLDCSIDYTSQYLAGMLLNLSIN
uniref:Uncharacterized protein n=1 Tax=Oryza glumipatula TaxID=40148 RepID=A0A0D9ZIQ0_9ORYZ